MTLPDERYRSVLWAAKFLEQLATDPKKYPRVPRSVRREAMSVLRHFPSTWDMDRAAELAPSVFAARIEPLTRMVMQYQEDKSNDDAS